jgi:hypothetical protein
MLVLINGLPYFGKMIAKELNERDSSNTYVFLDTYYSKWDKIRFRFLLPRSKAFISVNGVSDQSGSLDLVLKRKMKLIMQWHGSDVKIAVDRFKEGNLFFNYIDYASHLFSAPWFEKELAGIVKNGVYAPFSFTERFGRGKSYSRIQVLSYLAEGKEEYYGWNLLKELAEKHPSVSFTIVGSKGIGIQSPSNVSFKGWVSEEEMSEFYESHGIFIRLCEHDGKSFAVSQALAMGCEVLWNYPVIGGHLVERNPCSLNTRFEECVSIIQNRNLIPNIENIRIAQEELSKEKVLSRFVDQIKVILSE